MPRNELSVKEVIPKIYRDSFLDIFIFTWILAQRNADPQLSIEKICCHLQKYVGWEEDDIGVEAIKHKYHQMSKKFRLLTNKDKQELCHTLYQQTGVI